MTLGERIATLRKEKGLSQEALGELVGVTRQAVSKWEADRAVPDVNNCVAMSKVLGVPLARLLELEEDEEAANVELDDRHLLVLKQLTEQYAAAQKRLRRRWRWPLILLACAALVGAAWLWEWLNDMNRTIEYLSGEMAGLRGEIVSGVGDRVEESLEADRGLVADYTAEVIAADVLENTVTVQYFVVLREGGTDMKVSFMPRSGGEAVPAVHEGGLHYTAQVTCPIEDSPNVDILVEIDGQSRSQPLAAAVFESDYAIRLDGDVRWARLSQTGLTRDAYEAVEIFAFLDAGPGLPEPLSMERMAIAVFHNDRLADTLPVDLEQGSHQGDREWNLHQALDVPVSLPAAQNGDTLTIVLLAEDNYGRAASHIISHYRVRQDGRLDYEQPVWDDGTYGTEVWP